MKRKEKEKRKGKKIYSQKFIKRSVQQGLFKEKEKEKMNLI